MYAPDSGTKDKNYDLVTVTQLCLEHVWRLEQYAHDAERAGDDELAMLFRRMQEHSRRGAEESKRLLARRIAEDTRAGDGMQQRERGRGAYGMERTPYGSGYGYRATAYRATTRWEPESRPPGAFVGRGPKAYTGSRERIVDRVNERLTDHPEVDASEIEVDLLDAGVVVLRGRVADRAQKRNAEDAAESVSGVSDVRNELEVDKSLFQELTDAITGRSGEPASEPSRERTTA